MGIEKVNVFANRAASQNWEVFQFAEPDEPEKVYTFRLRSLNELEEIAAAAFAERLEVRHLVGGFVDPSGDLRKAPEILAMVADEEGTEAPVEVTDRALRLFAELERMQGIKRDVFDDSPSELGYKANELAIIAATCQLVVWPGLRAAVRKKRAEAGQKKALRDSGGKSPTPASEAAAATLP